MGARGTSGTGAHGAAALAGTLQSGRDLVHRQLPKQLHPEHPQHPEHPKHPHLEHPHPEHPHLEHPKHPEHRTLSPSSALRPFSTLS